MIDSVISEIATGIAACSPVWQNTLATTLLVFAALIPGLVWFVVALFAAPDHRQERAVRFGLCYTVLSYSISAGAGMYTGVMLGHGQFVGAAIAFGTTAMLLIAAFIAVFVITALLIPYNMYKEHLDQQRRDAMPERNRPGYFDPPPRYPREI